MHQMWHLSEAVPQNLGLACTDEGLLLGRTFLIERRGERFVVRARGEIERLLKCAYDGEPPVDRLMSGLARVASALNANDQCLARIAAVHLRMPDLASAAVRDGLAAENSPIKYARDGGAANWNPALHPRTGTPPNPGLVRADRRCKSRRAEGARLRRTTAQRDNQMHRLTPSIIGSICRPPNASMNSAIFWNGWPMPSRRTNRQSARKSTATGGASVTFTRSVGTLNFMLSQVLKPGTTRERSPQFLTPG